MQTSNAATDSEKSDDAAMSNDNTDNTAMSNNNTDDATTGDGNTENTRTGETIMVDVPSPLCYGRKTKDPSKVKASKKHTPIMVEPSEPSIGDPPPDEITMVMASGHAFNPTDVHMYEFLIQGTPNPLDLEDIEEGDQLLEMQQNIQDKLKQRDEERERNITKRMKKYEEKYDFINKSLSESVAQITEMTKTYHPIAAARVKSADKMVMLLPFDGSKPEVAKQHYERFNQYIKFQTKSGNIRDPIAEAIELFEHTLDKKAIVWFQEHKDKFADVMTLKTMFLQRYNPWGKTKRDQLQS